METGEKRTGNEGESESCTGMTNKALHIKTIIIKRGK